MDLSEQLRKAADELHTLAHPVLEGKTLLTPDLRLRIDAKAAEVEELRTALEAAKAEGRRYAQKATTARNPFAGVDTGAEVGHAATKAPLGMPRLGLAPDDVKAVQDAALGRRGVAVKATLTSTNQPMAAVGDYRMEPLGFRRDVVRVAELIPVERTTAPSVFYFRATAGATAAAAVAEGGAKPESTPTYEQVRADVRKLAHYIRVNDEVLADFVNFKDLISDELVQGLVDAENTQLLTGDGLGVNLTGLNNATGIITRARGTDSQLDALLRAANDLRVGSAFVEPDTIVLHPSDFTTVRVAKDGQGNYLAGDPLEGAFGTIWGVRTVVTTRQPVGTALVANLKTAAVIYLREEPRVEAYPGGTAEFTSNQTLIRAEERLTLAVPRPAAIVQVTGL